jgi:hypothetical protein
MKFSVVVAASNLALKDFILDPSRIIPLLYNKVK